MQSYFPVVLKSLKPSDMSSPMDYARICIWSLWAKQWRTALPLLPSLCLIHQLMSMRTGPENRAGPHSVKSLGLWETLWSSQPHCPVLDNDVLRYRPSPCHAPTKEPMCVGIVQCPSWWFYLGSHCCSWQCEADTALEKLLLGPRSGLFWLK